MFDLNKWCGDRDIREWLNSPFIIDGKAAATNGRHFIAIDRQYFGGTAENIAEREYKMVKEALDFDGEFKKLANQVVLPEKIECTDCSGTGNIPEKKCRECDGDGELELDTAYNSYEVECATCEGSGHEQIACKCEECEGTGLVYPNFSFDVFGVKIPWHEVELLKTLGEEIEFSALPEKQILYFKGDGFFGVVMGVR